MCTMIIGKKENVGMFAKAQNTYVSIQLTLGQWVWIAWVSLYAASFSIVEMAVLHDPWLVESTDAEAYRGMLDMEEMTM